MHLLILERGARRWNAKTWAGDNRRHSFNEHEKQRVIHVYIYLLPLNSSTQYGIVMHNIYKVCLKLSLKVLHPHMEFVAIKRDRQGFRRLDLICTPWSFEVWIIGCEWKSMFFVLKQRKGWHSKNNHRSPIPGFSSVSTIASSTVSHSPTYIMWYRLSALSHQEISRFH